MPSHAAWIIRPAVPADAASMSRLARAAYQPYAERIGHEPAPMLADYGETVAAGHAWVAIEEATVVGLLVLAPAVDHLLLENVAVAPQRAGSGLGHALLLVAEEQARVRGLAEIRLYTNEAMSENLDYYPKRGYRETHRGVQDGFRRVFFRKLLSADG